MGCGSSTDNGGGGGGEGGTGLKSEENAVGSDQPAQPDQKKPLTKEQKFEKFKQKHK